MKTKKSFTLIELLVVVAIIGILAAVGIPIYHGFMTSAKISVTESKHKMIVAELSSGFTKCSDRSSTWTIQGAQNYYPSYNCSWVMADLNRFLNMLQYHFQWQHSKNPYFLESNKSESVSRSGCRADGTQDQLGKTCLTLKGNIVGVTSNIGDESGNSKYLDSRIFTE